LKTKINAHYVSAFPFLPRRKHVVFPLEIPVGKHCKGK